MKNINISIPAPTIERFSKINGISQELSEKIYIELLAYLDSEYLFEGLYASPSKLVDEAWHAFILDTKSYNWFCLERYGKFMHHIPLSHQFDPTSKVKYLLTETELAHAAAVCTGSSQDCGNSD